MKSNHAADESWLRAAVLGATWAASEIILGSFLHNLRIPFKGNILTAIGITLLIAASYRWKEKGLFWKSGLICALLKTASPSAVIFGPMIAIFMEAVLFGASVRLLGRNAAGFITGAALAQSWVLVQKIFNFLIFYGFNIVAIYEGLLKFAEKQLNLPTGLFWEPLVFLLIAYMLFGVVTAVLGMKMGRDTGSAENILVRKESGIFHQNKKKENISFTYSLNWLFFSALMIPGCMLAVSFLEIYFWLPLCMLVVTAWVMRYKRAMRQLSRPKFWISFAVITLLAALVLSYISGDKQALLNGLMTGIEMNARAAVVILGFSVLGTELYNPLIRKKLQNSAYRNLNESLELAFESLPYVFSHLPDARTFLSHPGAVVRSLITLADKRVEELKRSANCPVFMVTGEVAEGKTTFISALAKELVRQKIKTAGFYAARILENEKTVGYDLVPVNGGSPIPFVRLNENGSCETLDRYRELEGAQAAGMKLLESERLESGSIVFIDEIGRYEINGRGWRNSLDQLMTRNDLVLVIATRTNLVDEVTLQLGIRHSTKLPVGKISGNEAIQLISKCLEKLSH